MAVGGGGETWEGFRGIGVGNRRVVTRNEYPDELLEPLLSSDLYQPVETANSRSNEQVEYERERL